MNSRRKFMARGVSTLGIALFGGVATASNGSETDEERVRRLLREGKHEKAEKVANEHNVSFEHEEVKRESSSDGGGVSTDDWFTYPKDGQSTVDYYMTGEDASSAVFHLDWDLYYNDYNLIDGGAPADAAIIGWDDSQWGLLGLDEVYHDCTVHPKSGSTFGINTELAGGGLLGSNNNAIGIKVHDKEAGNQDGVEKIRGYLQIECAKQGFPARAKGRTECLYEHTWSQFGHARINFLEEVTITSGPVGVNTDFGTDSWQWRDDIRE